VSIKDESNLIVSLAGGGGCSLETSPGKNDNWVESAGHLPNYICEIAKEIKKSGKSTSSAIAIAVSRVKAWAAGGDGVGADTKAKAAKALAQWEALKAKSKKGKLVKASSDQGDYLILSNSYNMETVREAWETQFRAANPRSEGASFDETPYSYVNEVWSDYIIVIVNSNGGNDRQNFKVPYKVSKGQVSFSEAVEVEKKFVPVKLSRNEKELLADVLELSQDQASLRYIMSLANTE
jgi:hypothetical protein